MAKIEKLALCRESLYALTGSYEKAVLLNQLIYWSQRKEFDEYIFEEKRNAKSDTRICSKGWFYKTAENIADETMIKRDKSTIGRYLKSLIELGYIDQRNHPTDKSDHRYYYRVNLVKLVRDLHELGYTLKYKVNLDFCLPAKLQNSNDQLHDTTSNTKSTFKYQDDDDLATLYSTHLQVIESQLPSQLNRSHLLPDETLMFANMLTLGIPFSVIQTGIEETFRRFKPKFEHDQIHSLKYAENVILEIYTLRQAPQKQYDSVSDKPRKLEQKRTNYSGSSTKQKQQKQPQERVVPAAQPGKYERFYQVYKNQTKNNGH